jgi:hypothetical protein
MQKIPTSPLPQKAATTIDSQPDSAALIVDFFIA